MEFLKCVASPLPSPARQACVPGNIGSRRHSAASDPTSLSFTNCSDLVQMGDLVLDVGANVGQYTLRLSELVGGEGGVIAFKPIVETAEILAAMARRARYRNITLFNIAVSERAACFASVCLAARQASRITSRPELAEMAIGRSRALRWTNCPFRIASRW